MSVQHHINIDEQDKLEEELIKKVGKKRVESWKKKFQKATIQNDFVFCKTMQKLELCEKGA